ncbi:MAG: S8 family peptidase, partial [Planctomycetota bacterium]
MHRLPVLLAACLALASCILVLLSGDQERLAAGSYRHSSAAHPGDLVLNAARLPAADGSDQAMQVWIVQRPGFKHPLLRVEQGPDGQGRTRTITTLADRLLVRLQDADAASQLAPVLQPAGARILPRRIRPDLVVVQFDGTDPTTMPRLRRRLDAHPAVADCERDHLVRLASTGQVLPDDPMFVYQWGLHNTGQGVNWGEDPSGTPDADIDAPEAWTLTTGSPDTVVAVLDTGILTGHIELQNRLWTNEDEIPDNGLDDDGNGFIDDVHGYNFYDDTAYLAGDAHGSHVAGIIAGEANGPPGESGDPRGFVGVDWQTRILAVRFMGGTSGGALGSSSDIIRAMDYVAMLHERGVPVRVSNHSYGLEAWDVDDLDALRSAFERHRDRGLLVVTSAGNDANDIDEVPQYPAAFDLDHIIAVCASDLDDGFWEQSNQGVTHVDLAAPGVHILSAYPNLEWDSPETKVQHNSGTSMAAPHVTGAVSLCWSLAPAGTDAASIKQAILGGVDVLDSLDGRCVTGGRLNLHRALQALPGSSAGGPYVVDVLPAARQDRALEHIRIRFSRDMDTASFDPDEDIALFDAPDGSDLRSRIAGVSWPGPRVLHLELEPLRQPGTYRISLDSAIADTGGASMDQDLDGTPGEAGDGHSASIVLSGGAGPFVTGATAERAGDELVGIRLSFSEAIDTASWDDADLRRLDDPAGRDLRGAVTSVDWDADGRACTVRLQAQILAGHYGIEIGPELSAAVDAAPLDQDRDGTAGEAVQDVFTDHCFFDPEHLPEDFGYIATAHPAQDLLLEPEDTGVVRISSEDAFQSGIDLGSDRLVFYGNESTGDGRLFGSFHGMLSIGAGFAFGESSGFSPQPLD